MFQRELNILPLISQNGYVLYINGYAFGKDEKKHLFCSQLLFTEMYHFAKFGDWMYMNGLIRV